MLVVLHFGSSAVCDMPLFTSKRLQRAGGASLRKVRKTFDKEAPELVKDVLALSCQYVGVVEEGAVKLSGKIKKTSDVRFEWFIRVWGSRSAPRPRCVATTHASEACLSQGIGQRLCVVHVLSRRCAQRHPAFGA